MYNTQRACVKDNSLLVVYVLLYSCFLCLRI